MGYEDLIKTVTRVTLDMWDKGWLEANAGNISVRLDEQERPLLPKGQKANG